jgi:hypothetical protein
LKTNLRQSLLQICLLAVMLLALSATAQAQFNYTTYNGAINITYYTGSGGNVKIPATIAGLPVTSIGDNAFEYSALTSVTIPNSIISIGDAAFYGNTALTGVIIPDSVSSIGEYAFGNCSSLTTEIIPNSVTSIGDAAFDGCSSLTAIIMGTNNAAYGSVDGVLFDKAQTTLLEHPGGLGGSYTIPNTVTNIGDFAFDYCYNLTSVTIPNGVTSIGNNAFSSCSSLTSVTIPNGVTSIGFAAFQQCNGLTNFTIPDSVTSIGDYAFDFCRSLTNVTIGSSVSRIGNDAFRNSSSLTSVTIPDSVTNIGNYAFQYSALTSVTIPNSVTSIGDDAFIGCSSLSAIIVGTNNDAYGSVNGVLFDKNQTTLLEYPGGLGGSYTVPNGVTSIGEQAFQQCEGLTSVIIPGSVTNISDYAFAFCFYLTNVYFTGDAPFIVPNGIRGDENLIGSFIYDDVIIYYLPNTTGWSNTFAGNEDIVGFPTALWLPQVQTGDASFGVRSNQFGFNFNWASGQTVVVEACTNLTNPTWAAIGTNTLTGDSFYFSDSQWTNYPIRSYRLRSP